MDETLWFKTFVLDLTILLFVVSIVVVVTTIVVYRVAQRKSLTFGLKEAWLERIRHPGRGYIAAAPVMTTTDAEAANGVVLAFALIVGGFSGYFQWINIREAWLLGSQGVVEQRELAEVVYVPENPEIFRLRAHYQPGSVNTDPGVFGGSIALIFLVLSWGFNMEYDRAVRLQQEGVRASCQVLNLYEMRGPKGGESYYVVYRLPNHWGICHFISKEQYRRLRMGESFTVRYVPDDPRIFRPEW